MRSFTGKVAAVTGAASGIGRALALRLADEGCDLALADIDATGLADTAALVGARVTVTTEKLDVADRGAVHAWADEVAADHGRVNLVVNNAGVAQAGLIADTSYEDYEWVLGVNLGGVVYGTKAFLPHLKASGDGHIVNLSSIFGLLAQPSLSAYNAAKFGVRGFTEALRQELDLEGAPVSATCVHPGGIRTNLVRSTRITAPAFIADAEAARRRFGKVLVTSADTAARVILDAVRKNRRRVLIGPDAHVLDLLQRISPAGYQRVMVAAAKLALRRL